ncbi:MAG: hypothetical protein EA364_03555 [Balneolaceae bacterium]|nr:MAG: hypothetical protein EA364_03555 [Balneolaceae bacterium]
MSKKQKKRAATAATTLPAKPDFWDSLKPAHRHLICVAALLLLPVLLSPDTIVGGERFMAHDIIQWRAGAEADIQYRNETGTEPLWSPSMFSGMPSYFVNYARSVPHLDSFLSSSLSIIYPAFPYWVILLGSYVMFTLMGFSSLSALLGAIFIGFTTYIPIIIGAGHNAKFYAFSYIPWLLSGYLLLTKYRRPLLGFFVFALVMNFELRAGHPQVTYYFMYVLAIWWGYDTWKAWKGQVMPDWIKRTSLIAAAGLFAFICNVQPYLSIYEYTPYSIRGGSQLEETSGLGIDYAMAWSQGWFELTTLVVPEIMGGSSNEGTYWGDKTFTSGPHYLGAIAFLLMLIGLFRSKNQTKWVFFSAGVLTMLFSLGSNFSTFNYLFFNYMPFYNKFRAPEMWLMVTTFSFSVVAVFGIGALHDLYREKIRRPAAIYLPAGLAAGVALILLFVSLTSLSYEKPGERSQLAMQVAQQNNVSPDNPQVRQVVANYLNEQIFPEREKKARNDSLRTLVYILFGAGLVIAAISGKIPFNAMLIGLIVLTSLDLIVAGKRYIQYGDKVPNSQSETAVLEARERSVDRYVRERIDSGEGYPYRAFPITDNPFNNAVPSFFYPTIGGYSGAKLSIYQDLIEQAIYTDGGLNNPVLSMLNTKYIVSRQQFNLPGFFTVYEGADGVVMENRNVMPKAFFADSLVVADGPGDALARLGRNFDPASFAILESDAGIVVRRDTAATATVVLYDRREIVVETSRSEPGFLVLSEIYYPAGWKAYVNDQETGIHKTNYVLRGVAVPEGNATVRFEYNPRSHEISSTISWIANIMLMLIGLGAIALEFKRRRNPAEHPH